MARDISDDDVERAVELWNEIEIVALCLICRIGRGSNVEAR